MGLLSFLSLPWKELMLKSQISHKYNMMTFRQFLESDELGQPDQEDMSGNWDLEIASPEDINNASNKVIYLLRNYISGHSNPAQAIKNLEVRVKEVISGARVMEGIIGNLFGKQQQPVAPKTSLFPQEPEIQKVSEDELWPAFVELLKLLMSLHKGNRQLIENHMAWIFKSAKNRAGIIEKQKRMMKPKPAPTPSLF
jgi:hypothetical protein